MTQNGEKFGENPMMSETDWAWFAGIIDGEGHLGFGRLARSGVPQCMLQITNTDIKMLQRIETLVKTLGIQPKIHCWQWNRPDCKWKPAYKIVLSSKAQLCQLLPRVRPYLVCKGEQADLILSVASEDFRKTQSSRTGLPTWVAAAIARLRELNHRGIGKTPSQTAHAVGVEIRTPAGSTA